MVNFLKSSESRPWDLESNHSLEKNRRNIVKDSEQYLRRKMAERGYKEVLTPYVLTKKDINLQELSEDGYLDTERGFIPFYEVSRWLPTLKRVRKNLNLPIKLFSTSRYFFDGFNFSSVILDKDVNVKDIEMRIKSILDFPDDYVESKRLFSSFPVYSKGSFRAFFVNEDRVGEYGLLSSSILKNFEIEEKVGYLKIDIPSLIAAKNNISKKEFLYPQFTGNLDMGDRKLSQVISIRDKPVTKLGKMISKRIGSRIMNSGIKDSVKRLKILEKNLKRDKIEIWVLRRNKDKIYGEDCFKEIYVWNNEIYLISQNISKDSALFKVKKEGYSTGIRLIDSVADEVAFKIESMSEGSSMIEKEVIDTLEGANVSVPSNLKSLNSPEDLDQDIGLVFEVKIT